MADPALDAKADELGLWRIRLGSAPKKPAEAQQIRVSAGCANFAETSRLARNQAPTRAQVLAAPDMGQPASASPIRQSGLWCIGCSARPSGPGPH